MDSTQVVTGLVLVAVGAALMFVTGISGTSFPIVAAAVGAVAVATGTLLVGTSKSRQV